MPGKGGADRWPQNDPMRIFKILLLVRGALFVIAIVAFVMAGVLIPAERSFTNEIEINAPAQNVWQVFADSSKYTEWQTDLTKVEIADDKIWTEYPRNSPEPLKFTVGKDQRPDSMAFEYRMGDKIEGTWYGYATQAGVRLQTLDVYIAKDWFTKIMLYFLIDLDRFVKDWNYKLKQQVEK